jgi:acyl carrier protein
LNRATATAETQSYLRYKTLQTYQEILSSLYELLGNFVGGAQDLNEDTDLISGLDLTSLKIMDLLMEVEDQFDVSVPLNKLPDVRTIGDLATMLDSLVNGPSS